MNEHDDLDVAAVLGIGTETKDESVSGVRALMLAVLEDAIRCFFSSVPLIRRDAEHWIESRSRATAFTFVVVCETLGLDPDAVRPALEALRDSGESVKTRSRGNVRHDGELASTRRGSRRKRSNKR